MNNTEKQLLMELLHLFSYFKTVFAKMLMKIKEL